MSHFSFSISHTFTVFLSISSDWMSLYSMFLAHLNSHKMAKMALCLLQLPTRPNGLCFFFSSFLFLQRVPHALHHFPLREIRPLPCFGQFSINKRASFENFWNKLINDHKWALTKLCAGIQGCHVMCTQHELHLSPLSTYLIKRERFY